jgi:hypothetical protein
MAAHSRFKTKVAVDPPVIVVYGVDGIGKSSLAAEADDIVYLHTKGERMPSGVEVPSEEITDYPQLMSAVDDIIAGPHDFKWLVIDSVDGIEPIVWAETCWRCEFSSIEKPGFGKGYVEADKEWQDFLDLIGKLPPLGIGVIMLAHPTVERFDSPMTDPYTMYTIKLQKRANALVREKADIVAFMNYRVSVKEKEVAQNKTVSHAEGKTRAIYLNGSPSYNAKNRYGMPDEIAYKKGKGFEELSKYFPPALGLE